MEIRPDLIKAMYGLDIRISKESIEDEKKHIDSPLRNLIEINLPSFRMCACKWCSQLRTNFCWNCEQPHCDKHARAIFFPQIRNVNTLCFECAERLIEYLNYFSNKKGEIKYES